MADSDDDAPPPLSSLAEQVDALKLLSQGGESTSGRSGLPEEETLRVANVVITSAKPGSGQASTKQAAAPALRKGFFDAPPKRKPKPPGEQKAEQQPAVEEIPMIRAKKDLGGGPVIPDFLRLEPDEQAKRYAAMKAELVEKLRPTPDVVSKIGQDPGLMAAFDDPEVMAAVNDIAANPQNLKKHMNKPKVVAFYTAMGKLMGDKLESMGQSAGTAPSAAQRSM